MLEGGLEAVEEFFANLADRYGHPVDVPMAVYRLLSVTLPDIERALEAAHVAVRQYPHSPAARVALGRLQQMAGDREAARESLLKALELERPVPQSENLKDIRSRLQQLEAG